MKRTLLVFAAGLLACCTAYAQRLPGGATPDHYSLAVNINFPSNSFDGDETIDLPILQGATSTGANSVAVQNPGKSSNKLHLIVVGGDFSRDTLTEKNCFLTNDGGQTWIRPTTPPHGYRSCVEYIGPHALLTCGISGVDLSTDDGMNWQLLTTTGFHACRKAKKGHAVFLAGSGGRVARLVL